jgi:hypothetical protein
MKKHTVLTLAFLFIGLNFSSFAQNIEKKAVEQIENLVFDFSAQRINTHKETIEILRSIINPGEDTVYFLTTSCDGEQYSLVFDTTLLALTPTLFCNFSMPQIGKIAPKSNFNFMARFHCSSSQSKMKLGFDICLINKSYTTEWQGEINKIPIFNRPSEHQHILWAEEKEIK